MRLSLMFEKIVPRFPISSNLKFLKSEIQIPKQFLIPRYLVKKGCIHGMSKLFGTSDSETVAILLEGFENILRVGGQPIDRITKDCGSKLKIQVENQVENLNGIS